MKPCHMHVRVAQSGVMLQHICALYKVKIVNPKNNVDQREALAHNTKYSTENISAWMWM